MSVEHNIVTTEGDTWSFIFDIDTDGVLWDLTTYTAKMQVRESSIATLKLLDLSTDNYISMNSTGRVTILVPSSIMAPINEGRYIYDFELTSSAGEKKTLFNGAFVVEPQVTD